MWAVSALSGPGASLPEDHLDEPVAGRHPHEHMQHIAEAAVEAELETGRREHSEREARAHILVRLSRMIAGFVIVAIGVFLLPLPGPGWIVIAAGFVILAQDFVWAERTLARIRRRLPQGSDGRITKRTWMVIGATTTLSVSASLWWTFYSMS